MDIEKAMKNIEGVLNKSNEGGSKISESNPIPDKNKGRPESQQNQKLQGSIGQGGKKAGNSKQQQ